METMMNDLALTGLAFGLGAGIAAALTGYMIGLSFKLLNKFTH